MPQKDTKTQFHAVLAQCRKLFVDKMKDYGPAWRILRTPSITDQIFIKVKRIRTLQTTSERLVDEGIEPEFRITEYNRFYESAVFGDPELEEFAPDIVYIHTTSRNLTLLPQSPAETQERTEELLKEQSEIFRQIWTGAAERFGCPVIQNNFELPLFRRTGNWDGWGAAGQAAFIQRMNVMVSDYARSHSGFYVNDISYLSAAVGLEKWHDPQVWYLYKYAMSLEVIPDLAYSIAGIIKSIYGRNKKVIALDLDNTLWGGVIGDDGQEGIDLGQETAAGQSFCELQSFLKGYKDLDNGLTDNSQYLHEHLTIFGITLDAIAANAGMAQYSWNTSFSKGDINGDNTVDSLDASSILAEYARMSSSDVNGTFSKGQKTAGDLDKSGKIDSNDASAVLAYYAYVSTTMGNVKSIEEYLKK